MGDIALMLLIAVGALGLLLRTFHKDRAVCSGNCRGCSCGGNKK